MALRLRRGTDAERQIITPLQGELIYATDTKKLYIGDGSTAGGVLVGPTEADQFTELVGDTSPQLGGDLDLNGNSITGTGNINIDGTITATGNIGLGDDVSDVINVGGVINSSLRPAIDGGYDLGSSLRRWNTLHAEGGEITGQLSADTIAVTTIIGSDSTVVYDNTTDTLTVSTLNTNTVNANLVGNVTGNVSGDVASTGTSTFNNAEIDNVTILSGQMDGVEIGGDNLIPLQNITGRIITASNGFVGNLTGQLIGNVNGDVYGSLQGSVFAGDSSIIIDDSTGLVRGNVNNDQVTTTNLTASRIELTGIDAGGNSAGISIFTTDDADGETNFGIFGANDTEIGQAVVFSRSRGTHASPSPLQANDEVSGMYWFGTDADSNSLPCAAIRVDVIDTPTSGRVPTNIVFATPDQTGNLAFALRIDENQTTSFQAAAQMASYADATARDAAITSPAAGMVVFVTDVAKFQGYDGSAWTNLN